ncbi:MAG: glycosyl transferase family 1, partial [Bacteroidota bacterium]|nr:glycosyl transferase family 1 [Bacteroidota bacterium]
MNTKKKNKKVLIITYYWPPSGGAGVQRWLKFAKFLPKYGWNPIIYTPENGEIPVTDKSLHKDISKETKVIKRKIWEPYTWYKKFIGQKNNQKINVGFLSENQKPKFTEKISVWIRGNFFIPDARKFWIKPSVKFLKTYLKNNNVDAIISTGPPHSMHLIAMQLQKKLNLPWIADFRDPWTNIDFYEDLLLT